MVTREQKRESFRRFLLDRGLKSTIQREFILEAFLAADGHVSTEELYRLVHKRSARIGYATVHRTLKLLKECGLASEGEYGDGRIRYELTPEEHHDHIICIRCGQIVEFENNRIEKLIEAVAKDKKYVITRHRLELYGLCPQCQ